jgi:hypothetical protein
MVAMHKRVLRLTQLGKHFPKERLEGYVLNATQHHLLSKAILAGRHSCSRALH